MLTSEISTSNGINAPQTKIVASKGRISEEHKDLLQEVFQKNSYISKEDVKQLVEITNLKEQTIRGWFSRKRSKSKRKLDGTLGSKENPEPPAARIKT